jgi:phosphohistidine phosphatase
MNKKLAIFRHAKSSWDDNVNDHERPLTDRGIQDVHLVSSILKGEFHPDLILSSDATRARSTASIFTSNLGIDVKKILLNRDLYDFSGENLTEVIKNCDDIYNDLLIFGHNHALTFFVNKFGDTYIDNVPTSGVVIIEFDIQHWWNLKKGKTIKTIFPKHLRK